MTTTKTFDCVRMKHNGAAHVQAQIRQLTREQEIQFWQERSQCLREHQQQLYKQSKKERYQTVPS